MPELDHYGPFLLWAFGLTVVTLGGYGAYLRSRLLGARRRAAPRSSADKPLFAQDAVGRTSIDSLAQRGR